MRISDWSSDVCSSDLHAERYRQDGRQADGDDCKRQRETDALAHQFPHRNPIGIAGAEIADGEAAEPGEVARCRRLVEAHLGPERRQGVRPCVYPQHERSEEHTSELQSLMRISYAVFCLKTQKNPT